MKSIMVISLLNGCIWLFIMLFFQLLFKFSNFWVWSISILAAIVTGFWIMVCASGVKDERERGG